LSGLAISILTRLTPGLRSLFRSISEESRSSQ
jgi:hypothetical protein